MTAPSSTFTFWPRMQRSPILAPDITCEKCQTLVPAPMTAPSSTQAVSWTKKEEEVEVEVKVKVETE